MQISPYNECIHKLSMKAACTCSCISPRNTLMAASSRTKLMVQKENTHISQTIHFNQGRVIFCGPFDMTFTQDTTSLRRGCRKRSTLLYKNTFKEGVQKSKNYSSGPTLFGHSSMCYNTQVAISEKLITLQFYSKCTKI